MSDIPTDLRPISLTPTLSKICESFVSDWLISSIKNRIDKRQFGSLKNFSTTHNLISLVHHLLKETDASKCAVRDFLLDFAKAFDLIDHNILLSKLIDLNVPVTIFNWIKSFLTERRQRVKLGSCFSNWRAINGGVSKGSVLGPVLFLVMINDLLDEWSDRWKYVDDSTAAESVMPDCNSKLQDLVDYIYSWTVKNNMKLNVTKCKEMVFDFSEEKRNFPSLQIDNTEVERVNSAEILGVTIQNNMNWWEHVTKIVKKAGKRLYMLRLLKRANADIKALSTVYITVIRPVLEYACQVWHFNIPEYLSDDIERIQKRALGVILPELCYTDAREFINISTLKERRESLCDHILFYLIESGEGLLQCIVFSYILTFFFNYHEALNTPMSSSGWNMTLSSLWLGVQFPPWEHCRSIM